MHFDALRSQVASGIIHSCVHRELSLDVCGHFRMSQRPFSGTYRKDTDATFWKQTAEMNEFPDKHAGRQQPPQPTDLDITLYTLPG